jgi:hypothetical protein
VEIPIGDVLPGQIIRAKFHQSVMLRTVRVTELRPDETVVWVSGFDCQLNPYSGAWVSRSDQVVERSVGVDAVVEIVVPPA